jgi:hypothetical protein
VAVNVPNPSVADASVLGDTGAMNRDLREDRYIPPGTPVRFDGLVEGGPEYGVVVHCWHDDGIEMYDCYVAFFGSAFPSGKPEQKPYVLRYAAVSLNVVEG